MTHTPRPWERRGWLIVNPGNDGLILDGRMRRPKSLFESFVWDSERTVDEQTANIILAAAAPELLAVCQDRLGQYESPATTLRAIAEAFDEKTPWSLFLRQKAAQMDNAITRAEGEQ